jgi:glycogen(starch) synthase
MRDRLDGTDREPRVVILSRAVFPRHGVGGLERHVYDLVRHVSGRGIRVTLVTRPPAAGAQPAGSGLENVETVTVPYWTFPLAGRRGTTVLDRSTAYLWFGYRAGRVAAQLAQMGQADIVHGLGAASLGYALAKRAAPGTTVPFVMNPQGLEEFGGADGSFGGHRAKRLGYAPLRRAVRVCADAADRVIATDRSIEPAITRHLGVGPARMRLVPNAIDVDECKRLGGPADGARARALLGLPDETPLLVSVGRLEFNKGFHVLIDALATMTDCPWRWVLVGDGPHRPELEHRVASAGIGSRMRFAGRVDDHTLHAWYEAATLFVHPTLYEGSSLVTLEAMAHRRAVVATLAGGLPDKVRTNETGWLVPPGDAPALAAALRGAFAASARLPVMGEAGRALLEAEFSWPAVTDRLMDVYEELLAGSPPHG